MLCSTQCMMIIGFLIALVCECNQRSLSSKRIGSELRDIYKEGLSLDVPYNISNVNEPGIRLSPIKDNILEWHFSFTGVEGSAFEGGVYHGRIKLDSEYPRKAPSICLFTQSGRWEVNKDICLSASQYHPETWNPNWNLRTLVLSLRAFMTTQPREIGSVSATPMVQKVLAKESRHYFCKTCGLRHESLLESSGAAALQGQLNIRKYSNIGSKKNSHLSSSIQARNTATTTKKSIHSTATGPNAVVKFIQLRFWALIPFLLLLGWKLFLSYAVTRNMETMPFI